MMTGLQQMPSDAKAVLNESMHGQESLRLSQRFKLPHLSFRSCAKTRPSRHRRKNRASPNQTQTQTLARERVTRQPPTFDCRSTVFQAIPLIRELEEMLTPSTLRAMTTSKVVLALFTVGDVYASLCKKSVYAPFIAQRRSRALFWL